MELTQSQQFFLKVIERAWEDTDFKNELVANPVAAIEKLTGKELKLPEGKVLVVHDQTKEDTIYLSIPAKQNLDDIELTEEQLELAAGGGVNPIGILFPDPIGGGEKFWGGEGPNPGWLEDRDLRY